MLKLETKETSALQVVLNCLVLLSINNSLLYLFQSRLPLRGFLWLSIEPARWVEFPKWWYQNWLVTFTVFWALVAYLYVFHTHLRPSARSIKDNSCGYVVVALWALVSWYYGGISVKETLEPINLGYIFFVLFSGFAVVHNEDKADCLHKIRAIGYLIVYVIIGQGLGVSLHVDVVFFLVYLAVSLSVMSLLMLLMQKGMVGLYFLGTNSKRST